MSKVVLIHWNEREAAERCKQLRDAGHSCSVYSEGGGPSLAKLSRSTPDLYIIDLTRIPSQGRAVGVWLRQRKATRSVPLLFAGGEAKKVERTRQQLPDAGYCRWTEVREGVRRTLARPLKNPVVPGTMAGYSGTPLVKKLGIKERTAVALLGAPEGFSATLGDLPPGVTLRSRAVGSVNRVLLFAPSQAVLRRRFPNALKTLEEGGGLWILWPKKSSGMDSDLTEREVRRFGLERGLVDYKICAVDATWSGLQFARRKPEP